MKNNPRRWKFAIGIAIILSVAMWEAVSGFQQSKTYYVTVSELMSGTAAARERVRVGGTVEDGSITRQDGTLRFRLAQGAESVPVVYVGSDTLPDTFKGGAQAIIEGRYAMDGSFRASQVQAKCASKYQAMPHGPNQARMGGMKAAATRSD